MEMLTCLELRSYWESWHWNPNNLTPELSFLTHYLISQYTCTVSLSGSINRFLRGDGS